MSQKKKNLKLINDVIDLTVVQESFLNALEEEVLKVRKLAEKIRNYLDPYEEYHNGNKRG